jgi:hypothetical protein
VEKIIPLITKIYGFLNSTIIPHYDDPLLLDYETASVDALKKEINEMHERAREDIQGTLMTVNEGRDRIGLGEREGGDVLLMPKNMIPLSATPSSSSDLSNATLDTMNVYDEQDNDVFQFDITEAFDSFDSKADVSDLNEGTKVTWGPSNATRYARVEEVHMSGSVTSRSGSDNETTMEASEDNPVIELQHYDETDDGWELTETYTVHRPGNLEIVDSLPGS